MQFRRSGMHVTHRKDCMDLEQMRQLVEVAQTGSVSAAARNLHMTQPTLSRSLKRLEAELGHTLFDRTANRAHLNDAGRAVVNAAHDILGAERRMRDALDEISRRARAVKVASIAPAPTWNLTARVVERFPNTILDPELADESDLLRLLFDQACDLCITRKPIALPNCECVPLMTESLMLSAPEASRFAGMESVAFSDLDGETFLIFEQIGFWRTVHEGAMPNARVITQKDREVFLAQLKSSDLLAFTTDAVSNRADIPGRVSVPIRDASAHATFYLVTRTDAPDRIREIVAWVRETG